jgi:site-specific recombinase XerD
MGASSTLAQWQTSMIAAGLARRTVNDRVRTLARFEAAAQIPALLADHFALADWISRQDVQPATMATLHSSFKTFYAWALTAELRADNPMLKIKAARRPKRSPRPISEASFQRLLEAAAGDDALTAMLLLGGVQGLRVSEIARMHSRQLDADAKTITVLGKGGHELTNPVQRRVLLHARRMPSGYWFPSQRGRHLGGRTVSQRIRLHMIACRVPGTPHALRHYFCTQLVERGADLRIVQELARHALLSTTAIYVATTDVRKRDALALFG